MTLTANNDIVFIHDIRDIICLINKDIMSMTEHNIATKNLINSLGIMILQSDTLDYILSKAVYDIAIDNGYMTIAAKDTYISDTRYQKYSNSIKYTYDLIYSIITTKVFKHMSNKNLSYYLRIYAVNNNIHIIIKRLGNA